MSIHPEHQFDMVVCTNNDFLITSTTLKTAHRALGAMIESIHRAMNAEFDDHEAD